MERDQAVKHDAGKLRMELIPPEVLEALAEVLTYGADKYGDNTWQTVDPERYVGAGGRHYTAWRKAPNSVDEESGIPHIYHLLCNTAFLAYFHARRPQPRVVLCDADVRIVEAMGEV